MKLNKILFVFQTPPPFHGSTIVGSQVKELFLMSNEYSVEFLNTNLSDNISEIGKSDIKKFIKYFYSIINLISHLIIFRPNLIYMAITVSGIGFLKDFIYVIICKLFSVKIVYHFHNKGIRDNNSTLFKFFYKHAFNNQFAIVLSEKLKFDIVDFFKSDNIFICPNGMSNINISNVEKFESDKDSISLLFISNLLISKGILDLIEACNLLKLNGIKFTCNIIGAEKELNSLQLTHLIKKFDLFDCVRYVGAKYDLDKYKYLNSADILIYPSYSDCLPLVLIEALQFSLPIISTDEGAISDLVIDNFNGFIVEKKSPHSIFQKIVIYKNEFYSNYTLNYNSRDLYLSKYTLECFNLNLKQVIDKIMYE